MENSQNDDSCEYISIFLMQRTRWTSYLNFNFCELSICIFYFRFNSSNKRILCSFPQLIFIADNFLFFFLLEENNA
ncbi:hypothetical protein MtrunA17_Chr3g0088801 [Medicago truncatula]|uniref:Transmembrane protein n=1 Tax=Medicago truncatula TaxID=3880 RepID=A0A396ITI1_MEDTR|nr:hypothetical protein MtrunA17_Chr3g0088801 [Medicago truncatula]